MDVDLLAVGLTTMDIVAYPIEQLTRTERAERIGGIVAAPAGTAAGTALIAARLGLDVALAGAVGSDMNGRFVTTALTDAGVDLTHFQLHEDKPTSTTLLTVEGSGRRSAWHASGAGSHATIDDKLHSAARNVRFLHYGGIGNLAMNDGAGRDLLQTAHNAGTVITCDLVTPRGGARNEVESLLPFIDYFLPSAAEARSLSGLENLAQAAEHFVRLGARACIIKNGELGCHCYVEGVHFDMPAYAVDAIDTTSCGDAFCAGFIAGLAHDWDVRQSCRIAAAAAAAVACGLGTIGKLEGFSAVFASIETFPVRRRS